MNIYESIKNNLHEADVRDKTITNYAIEYLNGEMDMDVSDNEIDMLVALSFDFNEEPTDYYSKFIKLLSDRTKVDKINGDILVCRFSDVFKPYNEECKDIFDMENSEFDENEAYYEAVANLEPLISGNAGESTYKDMYDMLTGNYKIAKESDLTETESMEDRCRKIFNKYRDEFDTINEVRDIADYLNKLYSEGGMTAVDNWFLPAATEEYKKDYKSLINK